MNKLILILTIFLIISCKSQTDFQKLYSEEMYAESFFSSLNLRTVSSNSFENDILIRYTLTSHLPKDNEELNKRLVSVFGIGPWSVNMFEIFCLGRLDIFSSKDAGLRLAMNNSKMVQPDSDWIKYDEYAKKWSPYRTIAALHLWKTVD